jgi:hypothetical protein
MLADLDDRLGQPVQGGRSQPGGIPGPLVLGDGVQEEALLVAFADLGSLAPLQRDDVRQAPLAGRESRIVLLAGHGQLHHGQQATSGINHGTEDYTNNSRNPDDTGRFP